MHERSELVWAARYERERVSPFTDLPTMRGAVWLRPRLHAEISYADAVGGYLRAPVWRGLVRR